MSTMISILEELRRLLTDSSHPAQAAFVAELIELHPSDPHRFTQLLQSIGMWGGAGAVWEVGPINMDEKAFRSAIIALADQMEAEGIGSDRSRFVAVVFRKWNDMGI